MSQKLCQICCATRDKLQKQRNSHVQSRYNFTQLSWKQISTLQMRNSAMGIEQTSNQAPSNLSCAAPIASTPASAAACGLAHKEVPARCW